MAGHIQFRIGMRGSKELQGLDNAYSTLPVTSEKCIGVECAFFDKENGYCEASIAPITPNESVCTQTEGPLRIEKANPN